MSCILPILCVVFSGCPPYLVQSCSEISYFCLHVLVIIQSLASRLPTHIFFYSVSYPILPITSFDHQLSVNCVFSRPYYMYLFPSLASMHILFLSYHFCLQECVVKLLTVSCSCTVKKGLRFSRP